MDMETVDTFDMGNDFHLQLLHRVPGCNEDLSILPDRPAMGKAVHPTLFASLWVPFIEAQKCCTCVSQVSLFFNLCFPLTLLCCAF